jgi:hypothetical protein
MESRYLKILRRALTYTYLSFLYIVIFLNLYYLIVNKSNYLMNIDAIYYFETFAVIVTVLVYGISSSNIKKSIVSLIVPCAIFVKIFYSFYLSGIDSVLYTLKNYPSMITQLTLIILFAFLGIALSAWYARLKTYQDNGKNA